MRTLLGLTALALGAAPVAVPAAAQAQAYPAPHGSYERQCVNIQMNGQFLSAVCRGAHGGGQSSINVLSCAGDIGVDASGALSCAGPGAAAPAPPAVRYGGAQPPAYIAPPPRGPAYDPGRGEGYDANRPRDRGGDARDRGGYGYERPVVTLYPGRNFRGEPMRLDGPTPDLSALGLNDRVRAIDLPPGSRPWLVCSDAGYRGRCVVVSRSIPDTRQIGLDRAISSLRPAR